MALEEEDQVTLGDPKVKTTSYERYKGRTNQTDRVAFLSRKLTKANTHYYDDGAKNKLMFTCLSTPEKPAICCKHLGEAQQRFGLVLYQYTTDHDGELADSAKAQGRILYWSISETRYKELSRLDKQFPLLSDSDDQRDLLINCTEESFQKMTFTPCAEAQWRKKPEWVKQLRAKEEVAAVKLKSVLGRKVLESELRDRFGLDQELAPEGSKPPTMAADDIDLGSVLEDL